MRRLSKKIKIGNTFIGGDASITVQSMLNTPSTDFEKCVIQSKELEKAGCDIIRVAVPTVECAPVVSAIKSAVKCPVVADIHFDSKIALAVADEGVDKIRINPGNIGSNDKIRSVAERCNLDNIPIRIGVNSGSLQKDLLEKYGGPTAEALCESALQNVALLEQFEFTNIVISVKSSTVKTTYDTNVLLSERCEYPLHLGVTEAGCEKDGTIKSSCAIGGLLLAGIGDTIRVSLTADPVLEVLAGIKLLENVGYRKPKINVISCPTCGRTKIDLISLANKVNDALANCDKNITVAVMGCVVNGPGEAKEADIGIAGGDGCGIIFKKGKVIKKVDESKLLNALIDEVNNFEV